MENAAYGTVPEYGAIFISNSMTRKECLKRKLFGLPSWLGNFVLQIKSGMILFLFEYEKRVLYGVFQAISDGAMNIVPHAYSSSGQQFPAQVKFSVLWCCNPLSEDQFQNAIKENYFSATKFNFGLSKVQVHRLLSLFSLTKFSDRLHLRQLTDDSFECSRDYLIDESPSVADGKRLILNGRLQEKLMEGEGQVNTMQESPTLSHYSIRNMITSAENPIHCSCKDTRNLTYNSGCQSNSQITMPSLHSHADRMTLPFKTSENLENITGPSVTQSQINVSCSDPNFTLPTREFGNDGSLRRSIVTNEYPSNGFNDSLFPYLNEQGLARQENTEAYYMYVPETKEFPRQLPLDAVEVSNMPSSDHPAANHGHECYGSSGSIHSDRESKGSVFSRLVYPSNANIQESNDYADLEKFFLDPSTVEIMSVLQRHHWQWKKTNHEMLSPECNVGRNSVNKKQTKYSLSSYSNCFQVSDELGTDNEDSIDGNSNHIATGIPFVNFKRRRKHCKVENDAPTGGENVNVGSVQLSGVQQKRRKLIRPSFAYNELRDSEDTKRGKNSLFRGKASIDHIIETDKTLKLCQAVEFPDIIWLADDEENNNGSETVATEEDCCGSNINGSGDRIASSNYSSDLNFGSKDLGVNESCSSTHKCSTSEDHMASQNLNNSGLCSRQGLSLVSSDLNAGNSFTRLNEGSNKCNEKELIENTRIVDEPYEGYFAVTESSGKS